MWKYSMKISKKLKKKLIKKTEEKIMCYFKISASTDVITL